MKSNSSQKLKTSLFSLTDLNKFNGNYSLKSDITIDDLGDPTFLYQIDVREIQDWYIKHDKEGFLLTEGNYSINDYKQIRRDEILGEILK